MWQDIKRLLCGHDHTQDAPHRHPIRHAFWVTTKWTVAAVVGALSFVIAVAYLWRTFNHDIIVMPLGIPPALAERGYTSAAVVDLLQSEIEKLARATEPMFQGYQGPWDNVARLRRVEELEVSLPKTGTSLSTLLVMAYDMFGRNYNLIRGHVVCEHQNCDPPNIRIHLSLHTTHKSYSFGDRATSRREIGASVGGEGLADLDGRADQVALELLSYMQPAMFLAYYFEECAQSADLGADVPPPSPLPSACAARDVLANRVNDILQANLPKGDDAASVKHLKEISTALIAAGAHREAILKLSQAIGLKPDDAEAFAMRGDAFLQSHQHASAIADLEEAVRLASRTTPPSPYVNAHKAGDYYNNLGRAHYDNDNYAQALVESTKALEHALDAEYLINRGYALLMLDVQGDAREAFERAGKIRLREGKTTFPADFGLALADYLEGRYAEAEMAFIRADERSEKADARRWEILSRMRDLGWTPSQPSEQEQPKTWDDAVIAYLLAGLTDAQLLEYSKVWFEGDKPRKLRRANRPAEAYFYIGTVKLHLGDLSGAQACFDLAAMPQASFLLEHHLARREAMRLDQLGVRPASECAGVPRSNLIRAASR